MNLVSWNSIQGFLGKKTTKPKDPKFCVTCKHFTFNLSNKPRCTRTKDVKTNLVTGKVTTIEYTRDCEEERQPQIGLLRCGPDALYFEPKETS